MEYLGRKPDVLDNQVQISNAVPSSHSHSFTETEQRLTSIWADLLDCDDIECQSDFFLMRGDSLTAMRLVNQIDEELSIKISMREVFENRVLEDQARLLDRRIREQQG